MNIVQSFSALLRRLGADGDPDHADAAGEDLAELQLDLLLLREENARLKSERHRPHDLGRLIDHVRAVAAQELAVENAEEGWRLLSECFLLREALAQAGVETEAAIAAVQQRLDEFAHELDVLPPVSVACVDSAHGGERIATPSRGLVSAA
ncbi:MAG: hypothetical protein JO153_01845 [Solirubrobacterales bacterium]|nr:hypothetical protein [Solirubrobacterales bacterium]